MLYRIRHTTKYAYTDTVSVCHNLVRLHPVSAARQTTRTYSLVISPEPTDLVTRIDAFGNQVQYFSIQDAHRSLSLTSFCEVEVGDTAALPQVGPTWEEVRETLMTQRYALNDVFRFVFASSRAPDTPEIRDYAAPSFPPGRPLHDAVLDLTRRIHEDFEYQSGATHVDTPVLEALQRRVGVCQDFAHIQIACLRSLGLAARYVSGYLRTVPPTGKPKLVGADESHAWASVWCGDAGWIDFDPTNNCIPSTDHVTLAIGRDYSDVAPVQGVFVGGGAQTVSVSVDVAERNEKRRG